MACCLEVKHNLILQTNGNWRLQMWTSNAENISPNIFVWQRKPDVPQAGSPKDFFVNIAQVCDLDEYPDDVPGDESSFFRLPYMDVDSYLDHPFRPVSFAIICSLKKRWTTFIKCLVHLCIQ